MSASKPRAHSHLLHRFPAPLLTGIAGACGGAAAAIITCPLDVAKIRLQAQREQVHC